MGAGSMHRLPDNPPLIWPQLAHALDLLPPRESRKVEPEQETVLHALPALDHALNPSLNLLIRYL